MKRLAKIGDVEITVVEEENPVDSVSITDNAVENGQDVSDHVKRESSIINLTGAFVGDDAPSNLQKLKKYMYEGELLQYVGRNAYSNMAIESIDRNHSSEIANGFFYDIVLKQVRIATAKEVEINVANPKTKKADPKTTVKVKKPVNNGKQQAKSKSVTPSATHPVSNMNRASTAYKGGIM